jgi:leader peptidase (prepilin peptidase)/N-methyltransferase
VIILLAFLCGLLIGSFLNVCIHRWPREESVVKPRSRCPSCGANISWHDNIPVFSYLLLRGRCRHCSGRISLRYPIVELLNGLLYALVAMRFGLDPLAFKTALFGSMMVVLFFTDLAEFILPDEITIGGTIAGLALSLWIPVEAGPARLFLLLSDTQAPEWAASLTDAAAAALLLGGLLFVIGEVYYRLRHIEGLGFGDVKMVAMIAAFWGLSPTVLILIVSSLVGAITGILIVVIGRKHWHYALPFGSYLAATAVVVTIWSDAILSSYFDRMMPPA